MTPDRGQLRGFEEWTIGDDGLIAASAATTMPPSMPGSSSTASSHSPESGPRVEPARAGLLYSHPVDSTPPVDRDPWVG